MQAKEVDEAGFAYSVHRFDLQVATSNIEKCPSDTQEDMYSSSKATPMVLDTGCAKAMRSRPALQKMKAGLHNQKRELFQLCERTASTNQGEMPYLALGESTIVHRLVPYR